MSINKDLVAMKKKIKKPRIINTGDKYTLKQGLYDFVEWVESLFEDKEMKYEPSVHGLFHRGRMSSLPMVIKNAQGERLRI